MARVSAAARRLTGRHRALWRLLAIAYGAQLAGELVWTGYDYLTPDGPPDPSLADAFYLTASVTTVVAILVGFGGAGRLRHLRWPDRWRGESSARAVGATAAEG